MALFFDARWFDAKLDAAGFTRETLAIALGLKPEDIEAIWKDQRPLTDREFAQLAALLSVPEAEIRTRAGVQGPGAAAPSPAAPDDLEQRLQRIEAKLDALCARVGIADAMTAHKKNARKK